MVTSERHRWAREVAAEFDRSLTAIYHAYLRQKIQRPRAWRPPEFAELHDRAWLRRNRSVRQPSWRPGSADHNQRSTMPTGAATHNASATDDERKVHPALGGWHPSDCASRGQHCPIDDGTIRSDSSARALCPMTTTPTLTSRVANRQRGNTPYRRPSNAARPTPISSKSNMSSPITSDLDEVDPRPEVPHGRSTVYGAAITQRGAECHPSRTSTQAAHTHLSESSCSMTST
jgi:hypothetical protein